MTNSDTTLISKESLRRLLRTTRGDTPLTTGQSQAAREAELALEDETGFESPLHQGHGNTVDDYVSVDGRKPLWRVTNHTGNTTVVRARNERKACANASFGGVMGAMEITEND